VTEPPEAEKVSSPLDAPERQGLQRLNLKLFLEAAAGFDMDEISDRLLVVFGRWRLEEGEEIIDLADYAHVPEGPGIILISHRWHFGIDWDGGKPGLFFSSRKSLKGTLAERIAQALRGLLDKGERLLAEAEISPAVRPRCGELEIIVNDRLLFPNTAEADAQVRPAVGEVVKRLYGGAQVHVERESDPGRRLGYRVRAAVPASATIQELAGRL
jgi:hypothetical protein